MLNHCNTIRLTLPEYGWLSRLASFFSGETSSSEDNFSSNHPGSALWLISVVSTASTQACEFCKPGLTYNTNADMHCNVWSIEFQGRSSPGSYILVRKVLQKIPVQNSHIKRLATETKLSYLMEVISIWRPYRCCRIPRDQEDHESCVWGNFCLMQRGVRSQKAITALQVLLLFALITLSTFLLRSHTKQEPIVFGPVEEPCTGAVERPIPRREDFVRNFNEKLVQEAREIDGGDEVSIFKTQS